MSVKFRRAFSRTLFCGKARSGASFRAGAHYGRAHTTYSTATVVMTPTHPNPGGNRLTMTPTDISASPTGTNSTSGTATLLVHTPSKKSKREEQATLLQLNTSAQVVVGLRQNHSSRKRNHLNCDESNLDSVLSHSRGSGHGHSHGRLRQGACEEADDRDNKQVVTQL